MKKALTTLMLSAAMVPAMAAEEPHWILRLACEATSFTTDEERFEAMGQLIYTAQRRGTTMEELQAALAELERRMLANPEDAATEIVKGGVEMLIKQHGQQVPLVSANNLGYEEFEDGKVGRPTPGAAKAASAPDPGKCRSSQ